MQIVNILKDITTFADIEWLVYILELNLLKLLDILLNF